MPPFQNYRKNNIYYVDLYVLYHSDRFMDSMFNVILWGMILKMRLKKWGEMWEL